MSETATVADARPYHHGDLRRALIEAARRILENEGPGALSLRAVAREAKVSPAAPYHHFKDKGELLQAVAHEGWEALGDVMEEGRNKAETPRDRMSAIGVGYVQFARDNPALYRVMYDRSRDMDELPEQMGKDGDSAYCLVRRPRSGRDAELQAVRISEGRTGWRGGLHARGAGAPGHVRQKPGSGVALGLGWPAER